MAYSDDNNFTTMQEEAIRRVREGGSMNTFFEPAFYLLLNLPLFDEEY